MSQRQDDEQNGPQSASNSVASYEQVREGREGKSSILLPTIIFSIIFFALLILEKKWLDYYGIIVTFYGAAIIARGAVVPSDMRKFLHDILKQKKDSMADFMTAEEFYIFLKEYDEARALNEVKSGPQARLKHQPVGMAKFFSERIAWAEDAKLHKHMLSQRDLAFLFLDVSSKTLYGTVLVGCGSLVSFVAIIMKGH